MYQLLFKNRLVALAFAAMIVLGVKTLIGTEDEGGVLTRKTAQIEANVQALQDEGQAVPVQTRKGRGDPGAGGDGLRARRSADRGR